MNILIFDTETANLTKPFCYNLGYIIADTENKEILLKREYVIEQVWHNTMLFSTAYYAEKRQIYVNHMRARKAILDKWGYVMQRLYRDIVEFEITDGYAYNCKFDEKVFEFNCDWFKTINPIENLNIHDIRGYVCHKIAFTEDYQNFCEENSFFTESENYSTTAEVLFRYVSKNIDFIEEHTALADSEIEFEILSYCITLGCKWNEDYEIPKTIARQVEKTFTVIDTDNCEHIFTYTTKRKIKDKDGIRLYRKK